jgi:NADPH-dependent curcumin reductase CurA
METGIEIAPAAFAKLFDGSNEGKLIVKMTSEPLDRLNA